MTFYYFLVAAIIIIPIAQYCLIAGEFTKDLNHFYIFFLYWFISIKSFLHNINKHFVKKMQYYKKIKFARILIITAVLSIQIFWYLYFQINQINSLHQILYLAFMWVSSIWWEMRIYLYWITSSKHCKNSISYTFRCIWFRNFLSQF